MKFKKFWINSEPSTDSEIVTQFKLAIDAVANGEKPWELEKLRDAIPSDALDRDEQSGLQAYLNAKKKQITTDVLNTELTKVLVGAQDDIGDIGVKTRSLGRITKVQGSIGGSITNAYANQGGGLAAGYQQAAMAQQMRNVGYDNDTDTYIIR
jgi:hypothetical protein